jgi:hypothetical protein
MRNCAIEFCDAALIRNFAGLSQCKVIKRLKQILAKPECALLKGVMWPFRKRPADLQPAEKTQLNRLFNHSLLRQQLTDIFDGDHNKVAAEKAILAR